MDADSLTNEITTHLGDAPVLHELDDGETARLKIKYVKSNRGHMEGVAVSFHFGTTASEVVDEIEALIEDRLDKRKFRVSTDQPKYKQTETWTLGYVDVDNEGNVVEYELDDQYLKPTEK